MNDTPERHDESKRLAALADYAILDTPPEPQFDDLVRLASQICETPVALISLVDSQRNWFKSKHGTDIAEVPRELGFCHHALMHPGTLMVVPDMCADERFAANPLVTGEHHVRFYAGMPLTTPGGHALGTLCVLDFQPRQLCGPQTDALQALARQVVSQMELRRRAAENARLCADARQTARRAQHAATHDDLTGLPNRTLFHQDVEACVVRAAQDEHSRFAVMLLDLDRFKLVNDSFGHAAGDLLLSAVGCRLSEFLAEVPEVAAKHVVARFGGDAFMILLEDVADTDAAFRVVGQVLSLMGQPFHFGNNTVHPGASVGLVVCDGRYTNAEDIIRDADAALHQAKAAGRGRCVVFDAHMHEQAVQRLRLEGHLRQALESNELLVHYQPVIALDGRETVGFEALVRWQRDGRLISPAEFIPIAEETGMIVPIGRWVLAEAVRQMADWQKRLPSNPLSKMAVNISRRQLADPQLVPLVRRLLQTHQLDPSRLMLEITESVIMDDADSAREVLGRLRELGVKVAMDDFGTGYSSLSCLHDFAIDVLKVDRSFVANLDHRREATVLRAVLQLAHNLGMTVVAEGIETVEQMSFLRAAACDFGQGYLFSKPLPAAAAEAYLIGPGLARSA